nr:hypothetical protein OG409_10120 [Streptomyces sp. NBC_00974]
MSPPPAVSAPDPSQAPAGTEPTPSHERNEYVYCLIGIGSYGR